MMYALRVLMICLITGMVHAANDGKSFKGLVDLSPRVKAEISTTKGKLFISVRKIDHVSERPQAVLVVENPVYPYAFVISPRNTMIPSEPAKSFSGKYSIKARHSVTGEAMPAHPEGYVGLAAGIDGQGLAVNGDSVLIIIDDPAQAAAQKD